MRHDQPGDDPEKENREKESDTRMNSEMEEEVKD